MHVSGQRSDHKMSILPSESWLKEPFLTDGLSWCSESSLSIQISSIYSLASITQDSETSIQKKILEFFKHAEERD